MWEYVNSWVIWASKCGFLIACLPMWSWRARSREAIVITYNTNRMDNQLEQWCSQLIETIYMWLTTSHEVLVLSFKSLIFYFGAQNNARNKQNEVLCSGGIWLFAMFNDVNSLKIITHTMVFMLCSNQSNSWCLWKSIFRISHERTEKLELLSFTTRFVLEKLNNSKATQNCRTKLGFIGERLCKNTFSLTLLLYFSFSLPNWVLFLVFYFAVIIVRRAFLLL